MIKIITKFLKFLKPKTFHQPFIISYWFNQLPNNNKNIKQVCDEVNQAENDYKKIQSEIEKNVKSNEQIKFLDSNYNAGNILNENIDELKKDNLSYFNNLESLALRNSDLGLFEKCMYYSELCLNIEGIQNERKVITTLALIYSLEKLQKKQEAIQLGVQFLDQVTFEDIETIYSERQLSFLKMMYQRVTALLLSEQELERPYFYLNELLYNLYEVIYEQWKETFYKLALKEKGEIYNTIYQSELSISKKKGVKLQDYELSNEGFYDFYESTIINILENDFKAQYKSTEHNYIDTQLYIYDVNGTEVKLFIECIMGDYKTIYIVIKEESLMKSFYQKMKVEKKSEYLYNFIKHEQSRVENILITHQEIQQIIEMRCEVENLLNEEQQYDLLNLIKRSVFLEQNALEAPIVDQQFVKNEYYKIKSKIYKDIQDEIEEQLLSKQTSFYGPSRYFKSLDFKYNSI